MRQPVRLAALLVLAATAWAPLAAQRPGDGLLVLLVRHAEKAAAPGNDPRLSPAGEARARALAAALADARVSAVVATQFVRTASTAAPLAAARGLTPRIVRAGGQTPAHVRAVAAAVRGNPPGSVVLVVGHSNTIPAIIGALGGPAMPELCDAEYANLFVLSMPARGAPRLVRASYGAPDAADASGCHRGMSQ